jgi:hypothetical protein
MTYPSLRNFLILFASIEVISSGPIVAMENDDDLFDPQGTNTTGYVDVIITEDEYLHMVMQATRERCLGLISEGSTAKKVEDQLSCYLESLKLLNIFVGSFKDNYETADYTNVDKSIAVQYCYEIEMKLYDYLMKFPHAPSIQLSDAQFLFLSSLMNVDDFIFNHFHVLSDAEIPYIQKPLAIFNFLSHITNLFQIFNLHLTDPKQRSKLISFATKYLARLKDNAEYSAEAHEIFEILNKKQEEWEQMQRRGRFTSPAVSAKQLQNVFALQAEALELTVRNQARYEYSSQQSFILLYKQLSTAMHAAAAEWDRHRSLERYTASQRKSYDYLLKLESEAAKQYGLDTAQSFTSEDFVAIYKELEKQLPKGELLSNLFHFAVTCQNAGDIAGTDLRLRAFAKLMGGSSEKFEDVPNSLKLLFAVTKYCQGEPEYWDLYTRKQGAPPCRIRPQALIIIVRLILQRLKHQKLLPNDLLKKLLRKKLGNEERRMRKKRSMKKMSPHHLAQALRQLHLRQQHNGTVILRYQAQRVNYMITYTASSHN